MRTIRIEITVPDGASIRVDQGAARPSHTPIPSSDSCPVHGQPWKLIPAGYSKTKVDDNGNPKRYDAFFSCPVRNCNEKPAEQPKIESGVTDITDDLPWP